tara:strand:+ start:226 stop:660 length:435 start_codon:yes stop_codon:yes gene_type:complete
MIVNCPSCPKKYKIDDNLIPSKGRLVQCSNCKEKWIVESVINETKILQINPEQIDENNIDKKKVKILKKEIKNNSTDNIQKKKTTSFFSLLLIFLITSVALFLLLDTFKYQISLKWKDFDLYIDAVYEIFEYMLIIVKDLFNSY